MLTGSTQTLRLYGSSRHGLCARGVRVGIEGGNAMTLPVLIRIFRSPAPTLNSVALASSGRRLHFKQFEHRALDCRRTLSPLSDKLRTQLVQNIGKTT
jgi:hypothetical protein